MCGPQATQQQQAQHQAAIVQDQAIELIQAVWGVLQPVLLELQGVPSVLGPACSFFLCGLSTFKATARHTVLVWATTLLANTPQATLATPQAMALLTMCLEVFNAHPPQLPAPPPPTPLPPLQRATTGSWDGVCSTPPGQPLSQNGTLQPFALGSGSGPLPRLVEPPSPTSTPPPPVGMDQHLLAVTNLTLMAGTERALSSMDAELLTPLLRLCYTALLYMPEVLAMPNTLDTLLTMTQ
ncbi:hypothetical protein DUNSADRAFT_285 [Dunaliella salina]|uniref:Uncharacterized protein n=1 Tax=Dunaliella salina TaxID=3046 RepID=A0ABQ7GYE6_DUNSA|nr:hypothetical protein DUNSADRAFT_285 [Dunaliella salina]|eukprot:KAF5839629.1 hypothetical protein DUNSADRAFT_285 [Dunaliella salina]